MIPRAPRPKSLPRTGKKRLKKDDGHPSSERMRMTTCPMINSLLRTAQKAPAGWLGTVLPLIILRQDIDEVNTRNRYARDVCSLKRVGDGGVGAGGIFID